MQPACLKSTATNVPSSPAAGLQPSSANLKPSSPSERFPLLFYGEWADA